MSSGVLPANLSKTSKNNFRLTEDVKSVRRSAKAGGKGARLRSYIKISGRLGQKCMRGRAVLPDFGGRRRRQYSCGIVKASLVERG